MSEVDVTAEPHPIPPLGGADFTSSSPREEGFANPSSVDRAHTSVIREEDRCAVEVDLRHLKRVAGGLPEGDPVRQLIEGEPDSLPLAVLAAKADSWVLLLLRKGD